MAKRRETAPDMYVGERVRLRFGTRWAGVVTEVSRSSYTRRVYLRVDCDNGLTVVDAVHAFVKEG